jgi:hypothetical protein
MDAYKKVPKIGAEVGTPDGKAIVVSVNMLKMQVKTKTDDKNGGWIYKDYAVEDIKFKKSNQAEQDLDEGEE